MTTEWQVGGCGWVCDQPLPTTEREREREEDSVGPCRTKCTHYYVTSIVLSITLYSIF